MMQSRTITAGREFHPAPKNCITLLLTYKNNNIYTLFFQYFLFYTFILNAILFFTISTDRIETSTISPTFTTSSGCLMNL